METLKLNAATRLHASKAEEHSAAGDLNALRDKVKKAKSGPDNNEFNLLQESVTALKQQGKDLNLKSALNYLKSVGRSYAPYAERMGKNQPKFTKLFDLAKDEVENREALIKLGIPDNSEKVEKLRKQLKPLIDKDKAGKPLTEAEEDKAASLQEQIRNLMRR